MKKISSTIILTFLLSSLSLFSQNKEKIYKNLQYINKQFSLYNDFQNIWAIDYGTKELFSFNKFGSKRGSFSNIRIELKDGTEDILKFNCKSGKCLTQSDNSQKIAFYTMRLKNNITSVIEKFEEIIEEMNGETIKKEKNPSINYSSKYYSREIKNNVESILKRLTAIFQTENKYKHKWYANWDKNYMYSKTESCEIRIPFGKNVRIELKKAGYNFLADSKIIQEKCTSFDNLVAKTYNFLNTESAADEVVYLFDEILALTK